MPGPDLLGGQAQDTTNIDAPADPANAEASNPQTPINPPAVLKEKDTVTEEHNIEGDTTEEHN